MPRKWYFVLLVAVAIAISYFDRLTLPVAIAAIQHNIPLSNEQFSWLQTAFLLSYAALYAIGGRLLDWLGTRRGFLLIMLWWSLACSLHSLATGFVLLMIARFLLGMGEGGAFPAATRVVAEWIEPQERSTAMGLINAGTAIGSLLAPPIIGFILLHSGWRAVFVAAGGAGLAWVLWWGLSYRGSGAAVAPDAEDVPRARPLRWLDVIRLHNVQAFVFAKFMSDSAWYFLLFWLPKYLYDARGFDIRQVSYYAWIPYAASGVGSFLGGWFSSFLLHRGKSLDAARKIALGCCAAAMPAVMLVSLVPVSMALALFSIAFFAQQAWSGLVMTLPADIFPLNGVGTVAGLIGFGGAIGGAIFGVVAGFLLSHGITYGELFVAVGTFHLVGFLGIVLRAGRIEPFGAIDIEEMGSPA
ncbi:MAG TPA: MFS transporter [Acidobacteriaceae bacterium]|jgi:ACS family hexuronate transporter-like MFS transporter|nr:MFS transporter [Acidobacteriaceae bacterium]